MLDGQLDMANRIRELREARRWSQKKLADIVGTSDQEISHLELSKRRLTDDWMRRIARAFGVHPWDLMDGVGAGELTKTERALVDLFRGLPGDQQRAFFQTARALAKPPSPTRTRPGRR